MIGKHLKKYFTNYLLILFIIGSFILYKSYDKQGHIVYYFISVAIFILKFTNLSFVENLGLSFKVLKNRKLYSYLIPTIILSNVFLILIQKYFMGEEVQIDNNNSFIKTILIFIFINSIRTFGEEFIFRGFLLIKEITINNLHFWLFNITQALIFSIIHSLFVEQSLSKIVFGAYVFTISLYMGWLNRKFDSLLPSWIIHWMNGLQALIMINI